MFNEYVDEGEWDFRGEDTKEYTHCFHIYPAMMIPQIARRLIELYGQDADFLFDPYCGTGTSLVEGRLAGMSVAGTDLNPTARLISQAKSDDYDRSEYGLEGAVHSFVKDLEKELSQLSQVELPSPVVLSLLQKSPSLQFIPVYIPHSSSESSQSPSSLS